MAILILEGMASHHVIPCDPQVVFMIMSLQGVCFVLVKMGGVKKVWLDCSSAIDMLWVKQFLGTGIDIASRISDVQSLFKKFDNELTSHFTFFIFILFYHTCVAMDTCIKNAIWPKKI